MKSEKSIFDPFATDLFLSGAATARRTETEAHNGEASPLLNQDWSRALPRMTREAARRSSELGWLDSFNIGSRIVEALARFTLTSPELVSISISQIRECEPFTIVSTSNGPRFFAELLVGPNDAVIVLEFEAGLGASIVERTLGGNGTSIDSIRGLSTTELAVIEFVLVSLCREVNSQVEGGGLRIARLSTSVPEWLLASRADDAGREPSIRFLVAGLNVSVADTRGMARVYLSSDSLSELNRTLVPSSDDRISRVLANVDQYSRFLSEVSLSVAIGRTELTLAELVDLDCGDVVVIAGPLIQRVGSQLEGHTEVRLGEGNKTKILGVFVDRSSRDLDDTDSGSAREAKSELLALRIDRLSKELVPKLAEHFDMEPNIKDSHMPGDGAATIDGLLLTVHVELAARRIRMDELAHLRLGQIIELGCRATDPVDLVVDGRSVARGELVDIEGRLGVRLIQVPA